MKRIALLLVVVAFWQASGGVPHVHAQRAALDLGEEESELPELETDRDAFTPATSTAGKWLTIVESSYSFIDNRGVADTHSFPEFLARCGVSERFELRLGWNWEAGGEGNVVSGGDTSEGFESAGVERESQILYGFKAAVTQQDGWVPRSATILQGFTPTSGGSTATDVVATYAFGWELANRWRLDSSMRYGTEHAREDAFNQWAPSVVLRIPVTERWNVHAEYFGIFTTGAERDTSRAYFSPGTHFLLTPNLELGVRVGWGITLDAPNFFSNVGIGWRF
jgi:Putative MetA-pathway of phenol degradation